jgi:hypothetical protein
MISWIREFCFGRKHGVMESLDEKWSDGMVVFDDDTVALDIFTSGLLFDWWNRTKWAHWISWNEISYDWIGLWLLIPPWWVKRGRSEIHVMWRGKGGYLMIL